MNDSDNIDILTLRSNFAVRFCISFQVLSMDGSSRMFSRSTELVPGDHMTISVPKDLLK